MAGKARTYALDNAPICPDSASLMSLVNMDFYIQISNTPKVGAYARYECCTNGGGK